MLSRRKNLYNEKFAYTDGFCCGFNGIGDLGVKKPAGDIPDKLICLNSETEGDTGKFVGFEGNFSRSNTESCPEGSNWCLVDAATLGKFRIFTIKKPFERNGESVSSAKPYDVASDGIEWVECSR